MTICSAVTHFNIPLIVRIKATRQCHKQQPFGRERRAEADSKPRSFCTGPTRCAACTAAASEDVLEMVLTDMDQVLLAHCGTAGVGEDVLEMVLTDMAWTRSCWARSSWTTSSLLSSSMELTVLRSSIHCHSLQRTPRYKELKPAS